MRPVPVAIDTTGRCGVAIARLDETSGERTERISDRKSFARLGERNAR